MWNPVLNAFLINIGLGIGLVVCMRQAIARTYDDPVQMHICVTVPRSIVKQVDN